jgi:hypothetical protein
MSGTKDTRLVLEKVAVLEPSALLLAAYSTPASKCRPNACRRCELLPAEIERLSSEDVNLDRLA